ncbi:MAG: hypothetical protein D6785_05660, partial [Planctomycetota bacterium]
AIAHLEKVGSFGVDTKKKEELKKKLKKVFSSPEIKKQDKGLLTKLVKNALEKSRKWIAKDDKLAEGLMILKVLLSLHNAKILILTDNEKDLITKEIQSIGERYSRKLQIFAEDKDSRTMPLLHTLYVLLGEDYPQIKSLRNKIALQYWKDYFQNEQKVALEALERQYKRRIAEMRRKFLRQIKEAQENALSEEKILQYLEENEGFHSKVQKTLYLYWKKKGDQSYQNQDWQQALEYYKRAKAFLNSSEIQQNIQNAQSKISKTSGNPSSSGSSTGSHENSNPPKISSSGSTVSHPVITSKSQGAYRFYQLPSFYKELKKLYQLFFRLKSKKDFATLFSRIQKLRSKATQAKEKTLLDRLEEEAKNRKEILESFLKAMQMGKEALRKENFAKSTAYFRRASHMTAPPDPEATAFYEFSKKLEDMVYIRDFLFIEKFEVTNQDYKQFIDANPGYAEPFHWVNGEIPPAEETKPVVFVSYHDALAYAKWKGRQLPTVSEWEEAARMGKKGISYPWGNTFLSNMCNTSESGKFASAYVGYYGRKLKVKDMIGNVWEWVRYDFQDPKANPFARPVKGGGFADSGLRTTIGFTLHTSPNVKLVDRGFRLSMNFDSFLDSFLRKKWGVPKVKEVFKEKKGMVFIPGGPFSSGKDEETKVTKPILMDTKEVTNGEYYEFLRSLSPEEQRRRRPRNWKGRSYPSHAKDLPVSSISYEDAAAYARWKGKRLPTISEWEKAARGEGRLSRKYPYGSRFNKQISYTKDSPYMQSGQPQMVGMLPEGQSIYGVFNLGGNVSEWTHLGKKIYVMGPSFMKRGSIWPVWQKIEIPSRRKAYPDVGFRCVLDIHLSQK